jgi:tetratricopeptide (TPR) repeat protein
VLRQQLDQARKANEAKDYAGARAQIDSAIEKAIAEIGKREDARALALLEDMGSFAQDLGDLHSAKEVRQRVLEVRSRTLPDDNPDLQSARRRLATSLRSLGDLQGARALFERVLEVFSRTLPDDHPDLQRARGNVAILMRELGDLQGARALEEKVLEVFTRTLPEDHPELQIARSNLAATIATVGDLHGARALQEKVLEVLSRTLPDDHPDLQNARQNLAVTIQMLGDLQGARALQEKVLEVRTRTLPDDHPDLQDARQNLAGTIKALGDLQGARALEEKVLEVRSRTLPEDHPALQAVRQDLANTIRDLGDPQGAQALDEKALEVLSRTLPDDHPDLQLAREDLAVTFAALGELQDARTLLEKVLEVYSTTLPDDHPDLQIARANLAWIIDQLGDPEGARVLSEQVLEVRSRTLPEDHPELQRAREIVAVVIAGESARLSQRAEGENSREREGGRKRCAELILALCRAQAHAVRTVLLSSPSREAEERCTSFAETLDFALSFARGYGVFDPSSELKAPSFVLSESVRGAAIVSADLERMASGSPNYAQQREALVKASDDLAALAQKGTTTEAFDAARVKREQAESDLIALARDVAGGTLEGVELKLPVLAKLLGERTASVSFRRFKDWRVELAQGSDANGTSVRKDISTESLCAFVVRGSAAASTSDNSAQPLTLVDLGPIAPIESAVREWREAIGVGLERGIGSVRPTMDLVRSKGEALRTLVLDPVVAALGDAQRVVVVLDDVVHLVPLESLPLAGSTDLVGDRWKIETRATLTELFGIEPVPKGEALVAFGGASFNAEPASPSKEETAAVEAEKPTQVATLLRGGAWEPGFPPLPQSGEEARGIRSLYEEVFGKARPALVFEKHKASRQALIELAPKARFLHIATHGWFTSESIRSWSDPTPIDVQSGLGLRQSGEEQVKGMSPMLLCGLALAGANLPENAVGRAPGLVTAEELSTLDLSNCELAVLSACDTNVGERRAGQGVASFQRALQMAGARSVITSLWKVPDEATKELMLDFYRRIWVEKKPKGQALWEAKKKLREAKDESGLPKYSTRDWAAWVLTGDPN